MLKDGGYVVDPAPTLGVLAKMIAHLFSGQIEV